MNIKIKGTHIDLTPAIRSYVEEKCQALEKKFIDPNDTSVISDFEVGTTTTGQHSGDVFRAEMNLHIAGNNLRAESVDADLYAAIDEVKDDMARQLRKVKTRVRSKERKGGARLKEMLKTIYRR